MYAAENHRVIELIMIELLGTIFFLAIVTVCVYVKRYFVKKSLNGCTVLITNGDTDMSQELAKQLSINHNCHVILVKTSEIGKSNTLAESSAVNSTHSGISIFYCNLLDSVSLDQLSQKIQKTFDGIDMIIDTGHISAEQRYGNDGNINDLNGNCRSFVDSTSDNLRTTINLLMHFIPKMKYSICGHFVTIQTLKPNDKPLLRSHREINELINHLTGNHQSIFTMDLFNRNKIRFTTILCNRESSSHKKNNECERPMQGKKRRVLICKNNTFNVSEMCQHILDGVRCERSLVHISEQKSLIDSIFEYFRK